MGARNMPTQKDIQIFIKLFEILFGAVQHRQTEIREEAPNKLLR